MAARAERQRKIGRVFAAVIVVAVIGAAASAGAAAMQVQWDWKRVLPTLAENLNLSTGNREIGEMVASRDAGADAPPTEQLSVTSSDSSAAALAPPGDSTAADSTSTDSATLDSSAAAPLASVASVDSGAGSTPAPPQPSPSSAPPAAAPAQPAAARLIPVVAEGRTELGDSVFALREGNIVTVHFDTPLGRTRRRDKFENMVRRTLPRIYGDAADSALAKVPWGALTSSGDLLADLPSNGIRLAMPNGATMSIWPRTRPGRDGPLVVAYRAVVSR